VPFLANVVKVMIASPGDVPEERQAIREVVTEWNNVHAEDRKVVLLPAGWETHSSPTLSGRPQGIINKQVLADCDLLVAVFWTRLGSPTGKAASGTVEEIEEHLAAGKPAMLYFSNAPVHPDSVKPDQYQSLKEFKKACYDRGLVESFDSLQEFRDKFARQLAQTMIRDFGELGALARERPAEQGTPRLSRTLSHEARELLLAAANGDGQLICTTHSGGTDVEAGRRNFVEQQKPREVARWRAGLAELHRNGLIETVGTSGEIFEVTYAGHQVADEIRSEGGTAQGENPRA
jgi:hypothetical protein